ncbi:phosphatase PAP2 family protein [Candidatus Saccharibacteria bacterium]|nr:phosphatase PAP2 family protein [Candidatus Saccharibacteria bacterium]
MTWELITNIILILAFIIIGIFAGLGISQWISRKSFKKIDKQIRWMPLPLALVALTYLIFDKLWVLSTRPNGSGEPSFPSTHVLIIATVFFIVTIILPKYIKSKTVRIILELLMVIGIALTCTGRVLSNMHWPLDIVGAIVFAFIYSEIYFQVIKKRKNKSKSKK